MHGDAQTSALSEKRRRLLEALMAEADAAEPGFGHIPRRADRTSAPLSSAQERLWFLNQYYPDSPIYNMSTQIPLPGRVHVAAIERALNAIVARHEVLRTVFRTEQYQPVQVIAPTQHIDVPVHEFGAMDGPEGQAAILAIMQRENAHVFDLATGPLLRAALVRFDDRFGYLLLTMHHIVSDGWSMAVLTREFAALYAAFSEGRESPLPALAIQYGDFAAWQRGWLEREGLQDQMPFWRDRLGDVAGRVIDLSVGRPRPAALSFRGSTVNFTLPARLSADLRALSQTLGATPFMTMLSGFEVLLHRYTGQTALVVGFPTAGRDRTELEGLIGFFVNSLPLRTDLTHATTFRELVTRVKDATLAVMAHQDVPFEKLVEELQVPRMLNANPVFQIMFDLHTQIAAPGGVEAHREDAEDAAVVVAGGNGTSKFDISLSMLNDGVRFSGGLEYSTDLFDEATIVRLIGHFATLLEGAVADPDLPIGRLPLLTASERERQVTGLNDTAAAFPDRLRVHQLFERQVVQTPDAVALVCDDTTLSYAELDARANRLAALLREMGVGPERVVGICMEGSVALVVAVLGVLKAGGAYLPLDPGYPRGRLAYMVADAGAALILAEDRLASVVERLAQTLVLDGATDPSAGHADAGAHLDGDPDTAAYVIYTSGSTGRPKGVVVTHPGVTNMLLTLAALFEVGPGSRVLHFNSFGFDISVSEILLPLSTGATLYLKRRAAMMPGEPLLRTLIDDAITTVTLPPSVWAHLPPTALPDLHCAISGGAACGADVVARWAPGRLFYNAYGPTEVTVVSSAARCVADGTKPMVGKPFANMRYHVVDHDLALVPVGVAGELLVDGVGLARGYLGRPGLTAERFVPDPFGPGAGARLYRTGDRVRQSADGDIEFLGRIDDQIEIRGFRIELGEIEAVLRAAPGIAAATVICQAEQAGTRIIGYAVADQGNDDASPESARAHLAAHLPDYMIPATLVFIDRIPLTPAGKVDWRALPSPDELRRQKSYTAPRTAVEQVVAAVWADLLQTGQVGVDENFFEIGGHSLMATQMVSRLRDALRVEVPVRAVFEAPTTALLAAHMLAASDDPQRIERTAELYQRVAGLDGGEIDELLETRQLENRSQPAPQAPPPVVLPPVILPGQIPPRGISGPAPLSFAQERLWFLDQYSPDSAAYNTLAPLTLAEPVNLPALRRSIAEMVRRHESLRTRFRVIDGMPMQVIAPDDMPVPLVVEEYRHLPAAEAQAAGTAFVNAAALQPFDLEHGPLIRLVLVRATLGEALLVAMIHHIVSDDWSRRIFFHDVRALYAAFCQGQPSPLAPLPIHYADFAAWQRTALQGAALDDKLAYWTRQLADAPAILDLPTDRPRPHADQLHSAMHPVSFAPDLTAALGALAREEGATMFMTVLAAFMVLLHRLTGQVRIPIGSPIANRDRSELEGLIGFLTNTLVLCGDLTGEPDFRTVLRRVRETTLGAFANQDLPFEKLVEAINPPRSHQVNPLFQVMVVLQKETGTFPKPGTGPAISDADQPTGGIAKFDLMLYLEEGANGLYGGLEYASELFDRAGIARLATQFDQLLRAIVADPDAAVASLSLMSSDERALLLGAWARNDADAAPDVLEQFAAQVARTPDASALVDSLRDLSFAALDRVANALAHRLVAAGVRPDDAVGVAVQRGAPLTIALLAVLKAGGAYLRLDPDLPAERTAFMLADAAPVLIIADAASAAFLPAIRPPSIMIDDRAMQADPPVIAGDPDRAAYIVYTSGSTGIPKGVVVSHRTLADLIAWQVAGSTLPAGSRTLQAAAPGFDVFLQEVFATWCAGGTLVCAEDEARRDPAMLIALLARERIARLFLPYVALQHLAGAVAQHPATDLVLREIVTAGEPLIVTPEIAALFAAYPDAVLVNQYGPSETHVVSQHGLSGTPADWPMLPPIGRPAAGAALYILDAEQRLVPPGAIGELYIGGSAVGRGYLRRAGATAERFLPDPFADTPGARMYRSGDMARHRVDGTIDCLGRRDHQVKIQGFRVELGEIEAALLDQPDITAAAVVLQTGADPAVKRLVAHVVPTPGAAIDTAGVRDILRRRLPEHMVPARIVVSDALPLTATGKIDRLRLPDAGDDEVLASAYVAPTGHLEETLALLWGEMLGVARPSVHDNFFDSGGHSLLGAQLVGRIRAAIGVDLPLRTLFEAPSIAALAVEIMAIMLTAQDPQLADLLEDDQDDPIEDRTEARTEMRTDA